MVEGRFSVQLKPKLNNKYRKISGKKMSSNVRVLGPVY